MSIEYENKTGTNASEVTHEQLKPVAPGLGIERVWREVVDFGDPVSGTGEEGWGRKRVSVARVSILEENQAVKCEHFGCRNRPGKVQKNQKEKGSCACMK